MSKLKLWQVDVETLVYCVAETQAEAIRVARRHLFEDDPHMSARVATSVDSDWYDGLPHHQRRDLPDKTCAEWLEELNKHDDTTC